MCSDIINTSIDEWSFLEQNRRLWAIQTKNKKDNLVSLQGMIEIKSRLLSTVILYCVSFLPTLQSWFNQLIFENAIHNLHVCFKTQSSDFFLSSIVLHINHLDYVILIWKKNIWIYSDPQMIRYIHTPPIIIEVISLRYFLHVLFIAINEVMV